ncbi:biotin transporter BioY [Chlamydia sp.]|uniref:biotin transporter BioY n=1 Tax=Chlamydia sp. TaxID=35827 RepID=UPI0025C208F6|nr:biotin transporter BioY [Chlamydia sp.]MBQ8498238.1 biotin transporter BioY [Chlamydia sp.]
MVAKSIVKSSGTFISKSFVKVFAGSLFLACLAKISISLPFTPVPITFQTLGVFCLGLAMTPGMAAATVGVYLMEGLLFPVFCSSSYGIAVFCGPTAGYLFSFMPTVALISWLYRKCGGVRAKSSVVALVLFVGGGLNLCLGALWLACFLKNIGVSISFDLFEAFKMGILPFLIGKVIKIAFVVQGRSVQERLLH